MVALSGPDVSHVICNVFTLRIYKSFLRVLIHKLSENAIKQLIKPSL